METAVDVTKAGDASRSLDINIINLTFLFLWPWRGALRLKSQ
jgi:hypothetical protein